MVKKYLPEKGDIVWLDFDPSRGKEIMKLRPAYVISRKILNEHIGMAIVAPITSTIRNIKLEVVLPEPLKTKGSVLVYQMKALDFNAREIKLIEKAPTEIADKIAAIARLLVD